MLQGQVSSISRAIHVWRMEYQRHCNWDGLEIHAFMIKDMFQNVIKLTIIVGGKVGRGRGAGSCSQSIWADSLLFGAKFVLFSGKHALKLWSKVLQPASNPPIQLPSNWK